MNIYQKVKAGAEINFAAPAFISPQGYLTHGQFLALIGWAAKQLHARGVRKGSIVGISLPHSALHAAVLVAVAQLGAVSVSLQHFFPPLEIAGRIKRFKVQYLIRNTDLKEVPDVINIELGKIDIKKNDPLFDPTKLGLENATSDDSARFLLTSGSTGEPQAVLHTHASWIERAIRTVDAIDSSSRVILPDMYGTLGNVFLLGTLFAGGAVVLARMDNYQTLISDINCFAVTHLIFPPYIFMAMMPFLPKDGVAFPTVKHLRPVGSGLSTPFIQDLITRFSPHVCFPYGISEVGAISLATAEMLQRYPETSGKIKDWSKAQVVDENDQVLPFGRSGQIRVAVAGMPNEYYGEPELSKLKFRDGWFYSSDHGYINEEGYLFIEGRLDDLINFDGSKINPIRIESYVVNNTPIKECAIFAIKVNGKNRLCGAFVASKETVAKSLEDHPSIRDVLKGCYFSINALPRNDNGKVRRKDLASVFANEIAQFSKA